MTKLLNTFHEALSAQAEAALIDVVAAHPNMTVAELAEVLAANPKLGATTLAKLFGGTPTPKRRGRPPGRKAKPAGGGGGARKPNVRSAAGREQFEDALLAALTDAGGDSVSATTLREAVGGDPAQVRTTLNRLIERGLVTFSGKARGTRYSLVA
jgi:predicted transcriptional regulator